MLPPPFKSLGISELKSKSKRISSITHLFGLAFFIALFVAISFSASAQTSFTIDKLTYAINDDGTVTLTSSNAGDEEINIPAEVKYQNKSYTLTAIGDNVFKNSKIKGNVTIPATVKSIGSYAFAYCNSLTSINLLPTSASIGSSCFYQTYYVTDIYLGGSYEYSGKDFFKDMGKKSNSVRLTIGKHVTSIPDLLFTSGKIASITFEDGSQLSEIGVGAFSSTAIEGELNLPPSVRIVRERAFNYCKSLKSIYLPAQIDSIGRDAFSNCSSVERLYLGNDYGYIAGGRGDVYAAFTNIGHDGQGVALTIGKEVDKIADKLFYAANIRSIEFETGSKLKSIGEYAFAETPLSGTLDLPDTVSEIGMAAFFQTSIETLKIPKSVAVIGTEAFNDINTLTRVEWDAVNPQIGKYVLNGATRNVVPTAYDLILGDNVEVIPASLFARNLEQRVPGGGVKSITWPTNCVIDSIGIGAFSGNSLLTGDIVIPPSVRVLGNTAFSDCPLITSATLPSTIENLGFEVFTGCISLSKVYYDVINGSPFLESWENNMSPIEVTIGPSVQIIPSEFVAQTDVAHKIIFDNASSLKKISKDAFAGAPNLTVDHLFFKEGLESIDHDAFKGCNNIFTEVRLPSSLIEIGSGCLEGVRASRLNVATDNFYPGYVGLKIEGELTIENTVRSIPDNSYNNKQITGVNFADDAILESIGEKAFADCTLIPSLALPASLRTIGKSAFAGCTGLTGELILPESLEEISEYAFKDCTGLSGNFIIPNTLKKIGEEAFINCDGFAGSLIVPPTVEYIGWNAFKGAAFDELVIEDGEEPITFGVTFNKTGNWIIKAPARADVMSGIGCPEAQFADNLKSASIGREISYLQGAMYDMGVTRYYFSPFNGATQLEHIKFFGHADNMGNYFLTSPSIKQIEVSASTPPKATSKSFEGCDYDSCMLVIPAGAQNAYTKAEGWKYFSKISGVQQIADDMQSGECRYYDLNGYPITDPTHKGVVIKIDADGKATKVLIL